MGDMLAFVSENRYASHPALLHLHPSLDSPASSKQLPQMLNGTDCSSNMFAAVLQAEGEHHFAPRGCTEDAAQPGQDPEA